MPVLHIDGLVDQAGLEPATLAFRVTLTAPCSCQLSYRSVAVLLQIERDGTRTHDLI